MLHGRANLCQITQVVRLSNCLCNLALTIMSDYSEKLCNTLECVYYGHLGTSKKCPDYQGVLIFQVISYEKVPFGTSTKCHGLCRYPYFQVSTLTGFTVL